MPISRPSAGFSPTPQPERWPRTNTGSADGWYAPSVAKGVVNAQAFAPCRAGPQNQRSSAALAARITMRFSWVVPHARYALFRSSNKLVTRSVSESRGGMNSPRLHFGLRRYTITRSQRPGFTPRSRASHRHPGSTRWSCRRSANRRSAAPSSNRPRQQARRATRASTIPCATHGTALFSLASSISLSTGYRPPYQRFDACVGASSPGVRGLPGCLFGARVD